jgi:hypothetical protein
LKSAIAENKCFHLRVKNVEFISCMHFICIVHYNFDIRACFYEGAGVAKLVQHRLNGPGFESWDGNEIYSFT